jgi:hypothetical protein
LAGAVQAWRFAFCVAGVGVDSEEEEEGAEDVFTLGDPGDGFDVQGVEGEERRDEGAGPEGARHSIEDQEEEDGVEEVEEEAGEVVSSRCKAVEPGIKHVGQPRQGMPIAGVAGAKGPSEARQA